ncbi:MAG: hypothetical protein ACTSV5_09790 [Promethearchaeota archaeon]
MKEKGDPFTPPRPNDKVRKIKGGFPSFVCITKLGGRNKSAFSALPKDKNPGWRCGRTVFNGFVFFFYKCEIIYLRIFLFNFYLKYYISYYLFKMIHKEI